MKKIEDLIAPFLDHCTFQRRLTENTVRNYSFDMAYFLKYLNRHKPSLIYPEQVTKETLEDYLAAMSLSYKVKTIKRKLASLHSFFTYLEYAGVISHNPFEKFHLRMKEGYRKPKSMTLQEMGRFLRTVYRDPFAKSARALLEKLRAGETAKVSLTSGEFFWCRDLAILELLFAAGLRVSELCGIEFQDYDPAERSFHILGKGNRERTLFLGNPQAAAAFDNYLLMRRAVCPDLPHIFITRREEPMSAQGVRNIVTKYTKLAGISKKITPHVFRHSFASLMLESGVDIKYIQDFLGHSSISTTQIYLHISDEQKKEILSTKHPRGLLEV